MWSETIDAHRRDVREAIVDTTAGLVREHGLRGVTMSRVARGAGIGRATLYKYFGGVEEILAAWHEGQVSEHLELLAEVRDQSGSATERLRAVLEAYAFISHRTHGHHEPELVAFLHPSERVAQAKERVGQMLAGLLEEGSKSGELRDDVRPSELAGYCLHALGAAADLPSQAAVRRLVDVTMAGLRPEA